MDGSKPSAGPLRIELATSQIEGGQAVGWVDPDRITGAVAFGEPRETFKEFVLPRLHIMETVVIADYFAPEKP